MKRRGFLAGAAGLMASTLPLIGCGEKPPSQKVAHIPMKYYHLEEIRSGLEKWLPLAGFPDIRGKRVVLKPNSVEFREGVPINTHPVFIRAVIQFLKGQGALEIFVAEGPGHQRDTEAIWRVNGYMAVTDEEKVSLLDLNFCEPLEVPFKTIKMDGLFRELPKSRLELGALPKLVVEADFLIGLPKLKCHHWTGVTLSLKNMFGIVPGMVYGWPKNILHWNNINRSIVEINRTRPLDFVIVDGIEAMEGDGPLAGATLWQKSIIAGRNPVSVDATCCRLMGVDPEKITHLTLSERHGLGPIIEREIQVLGEPIKGSAKPFALPPGFETIRGPIS